MENDKKTIIEFKGVFRENHMKDGNNDMDMKDRFNLSFIYDGRRPEIATKVHDPTMG
jgi:hypothetical protein